MIHTSAADIRRAEILAFHPDIVASALRLSDNPVEANHLADLTVARALEDLEGDRALRPWLLSLLRGAFHSVERQRASRRERGHTVTARLATSETPQ